MAEKVALKQERKLPFYEELRTSGLFGEKGHMNDDARQELNRLIKEEEAFELKINGPLKSITDYVDYVNFKKTLFAKLITRGKHVDANLRKLHHLKYSIAAQIKKLYLEGLSLFPQEQYFWDAYIKFLTTTKCPAEGTAAYEKMLSFHGDKPKCWLDAVQWEYETARNIDGAKNLLLSAIDRHPECSDLYLKLFDILLKNATSEQSPDYRLAIAFYKNSRNIDFEIDYWAKVLKMTEKYTYTKKLQEFIVRHLIDKFLNSELAWHILAQRELKAFHTGDIIKRSMEKHKNDDQEIELKMEIDQENCDIETSSTSDEMHTSSRLELCAEVYQSALSVVNTEKMWTYYINAMLELYADLSTEKDLKSMLLQTAFKKALAAKKLKENYFRAYIDILRQSDANEQELLEVIKQGPATYPKSTMPWEIYMYHFILQNDEVEVNRIFRKACEELNNPDLVYPLWRIIIQYYQTLPEKYNYVYQLYDEASKNNSQKFLPFRVHYLEFCLINKSIEKVRKLYDTLTQIPPPYYEMHKKMASLESACLDPNIDEWRKCYQNAVMYFGKERTDVWIDYITFEQNNGDPKRISDIRNEACATLNDKDKFLREYNIKNAIVKNYKPL